MGLQLVLQVLAGITAGNRCYRGRDCYGNAGGGRDDRRGPSHEPSIDEWSWARSRCRSVASCSRTARYINMKNSPTLAARC
jgi:hypothetical protein